MFFFGWLALRQVQQALKDGRLEEAQRLLEQPSLQGHRRHGESLRQLAQLYIERGERHLQHDDAAAAWNDLLRAEQLQVAERAAERLRQALTRLGLAEVRALLQANNPRRASQVIGQLRDNLVRHPELQLLEETTRNWLFAQELAEQGDFARAIDTVDRMQRQMMGPAAALDQMRQEFLTRQSDFGDRLGRLHQATDAAQWREVLEIAEGILTIAPAHPEARKARARAWGAVEPVTVVGRQRDETTPVKEVPKATEAPQRFYLWVDGVGGYLVCLSPHVTLGQAAPDAPVDVPLLADVSRLHATITRGADANYLLEAPRPVQVNGESVTRWALQPGDRLTLGVSCQLRFDRPVPVSASVRLDLASGHRSLPGVDGVLLMADTLVLGPGEQSHVRIRELKQPLVLFKNKEGLGVRYPGNFFVEGQRVKDRADLTPTAHVNGEEFSLAIEPASRK